jgi:cholesterol oxidase
MRLADSDAEFAEQCNDIDVIVIGSGYGASVCAARLAEAGAKVVVLERGRDFADGSGKPFPDTAEQLRANTQIESSLFQRTRRLGLFNFHLNREVDVLVGCGLGGTSLINSNVVIRAERRVLQRDAWPSALREPNDGMWLESYYRRALSVLDPMQYPTERRPPPRKLAAIIKNGGERCQLNVHYSQANVNSVGVPQQECNDCGDCNTGCNFAAKKTLCFTYLPIAKSFGARIFVQRDVRHIERSGDQWVVHFQRLQSGSEAIEATERISARAVVIGAGVLGTTGILLRSRKRGLSLSDCLGQRFSGNGDAIAFAYNCDEPIDAVGYGNLVVDVPPYAPPDGVSRVGATILGMIDQRDTANVDDGILIEESCVPSGLARLMRVVAQLIAATGTETQHGLTHWFNERLAEARDLVGGENGALSRTLPLVLMGHDGANGVIELDEDDSPQIRWPERNTAALMTSENARAREIASKLGGLFVPDPSRFLNNHITVHPLGGCPMGDCVATGVVDHAGRVFQQAGRVHNRLYVSDASVIPTSLGANPLLTITALAERTAEHIARDLGLVPKASMTLAPRIENRGAPSSATRSIA